MQDTLDNLRVTASKSSPITDALDRLVLYADESVIAPLVLCVIEVSKKALGPASKVRVLFFRVVTNESVNRLAVRVLFRIWLEITRQC